MSKKIPLFGFAPCAMLFALCCFVEAQQLTKVPRIGYVAGTSEPTRAAPDVNRDAFRQGLRDLGYIEGRNIVIEYRYAAGDLDRTATLVADLIRLPIDVLVSPYSVAILAAKRATKTMPIVMVTNRDPIATGMVDSLARPGGNVTGLSRLTRELSGKRLELLKEVIPTISRVGIVIARSSSAVDDYAPAAKKLQIALHKLRIPDLNTNLETVFEDAASARVNAIITARNTILTDSRQRIAALAINRRLPSLYETSDFVEAGGLLSYSGKDVEQFKRAAVYVDKILNGARPGDLPVEQPTKFELVINLKTAKQIGLTISPNVLARADRVIR